MPSSTGESPEHYYFAVEATDDYELWEDAKWFAFDKEYWGTPEREQRIEEINGLLILCAAGNWDSAIRGCLLSLYETELTAEERLNICYWGDATAAAWVDDPPDGPGEPSTPIPGPVAGWADPVSIAHDGRPDREHGWWVVNIPAPLCCKSSWYMVVRDKAANWRRAEPVDLPAELLPTVTEDPGTGITTTTYWGYSYHSQPPESGGYSYAPGQSGAQEQVWLKRQGKPLDGDNYRQYINLEYAVVHPFPGYPDQNQRSRWIEIEELGNAPRVALAVLDAPYRSAPILADDPGTTRITTNPNACLNADYKGDPDKWAGVGEGIDTRGDNSPKKYCHSPDWGDTWTDNPLGWEQQPTSEPDTACLYLQVPEGQRPSVRVDAAGGDCSIFPYERLVGQTAFWTETDRALLAFETSTYASDNYQVAYCSCWEDPGTTFQAGWETLTTFVDNYYQAGGLGAGMYEDDSVILGGEIEIWREYWLTGTKPGDLEKNYKGELWVDWVDYGQYRGAFNDAYIEFNETVITFDNQGDIYDPPYGDNDGWSDPSCSNRPRNRLGYIPPGVPLRPEDVKVQYALWAPPISGEYGNYREPSHSVFVYHGMSKTQMWPAETCSHVPPGFSYDGPPAETFEGIDNLVWLSHNYVNSGLMPAQALSHEVGHIVGLKHVDWTFPCSGETATVMIVACEMVDWEGSGGPYTPDLAHFALPEIVWFLRGWPKWE